MSFKSILHPTDFSEKSMVAFIHALKLAVEERSKLILMYVQEEDTYKLEWENFPKVRDTLYKWGLIEEKANRKDINEKLGVEVQKIIGKGENIIDSVAGIVHEEKVDLIVISTHGRGGWPRWLHTSISESISRKVLVPTLFIPDNSKPFVDSDNGQLNLSEILVPVDHKPDPQRAVEFGLNMGKIYGKGMSQIHVMHVLKKNDGSAEENLPNVQIPDDEDCIVRIEVNNSSVREEISRVADEIEADLIVMGTEGQNGFLDTFFGSTSERVLRLAKCPILTIPIANGDFILRFDENLGSTSQAD